MTPRPLALAIALATFTCTPFRPALAAAPPAACGSYAELAQALRSRFGETPRWRAEDERGFVLEFFAQDGGGWTLVLRRGDRPGDRACAVAAGTAWRPTGGRDDAF